MYQRHSQAVSCSAGSNHLTPSKRRLQLVTELRFITLACPLDMNFGPGVLKHAFYRMLLTSLCCKLPMPLRFWFSRKVV